MPMASSVFPLDVGPRRTGTLIRLRDGTEVNLTPVEKWGIFNQDIQDLQDSQNFIHQTDGTRL
jgi:hypothetical protein